MEGGAEPRANTCAGIPAEVAESTSASDLHDRAYYIFHPIGLCVLQTPGHGVGCLNPTHLRLNHPSAR